MHLKWSSCAVLALVLFTGAGLAHAQQADELMARLSARARAKLNEREFRRLALQPRPEFLIELVAPDPMAMMSGATSADERSRRMDTLRRGYRTRKQGLLGRLAADVGMVQDYEYLPLVLVRSASAAALARVLEDADVLRIHANDQRLRPNVNESLLVTRHRSAGVLTPLRGNGFAVGIFDTGVNFLQQDFGMCTAMAAPNAWRPQAAATCRVFSFDAGDNDQIADDQPIMHGSNVSGIAANVAPGASIVVFDVFNWTDGTGGPLDNVRQNGEFTASAANVTSAINQVIAQQQLGTFNYSAVNLSLGGIQDTDNDGRGDGPDANVIGDTPFGPGRAACPNTFSMGFQSLRALGIVPVVTSGNDGLKNSGIGSPGCDPAVLTVAASYDGDTGLNQTFPTINVSLPNPLPAGMMPNGTFGVGTCTDSTPQGAAQVSCFSNNDGQVEIAAPGVNITAGGVANLSGTSQAAPHVAGTTALLAQASNDMLTAAQIQGAMTASPIRATDAGRPGVTLPHLDAVDAILRASVWTNQVQTVPGNAWYVAGSPQQQLARLAGVGRAHVLLGTNTAACDALCLALIDGAVKAALIQNVVLR